MLIGPDNPEGSNVLPVTPVPEKDPPVVPVINVVKSTGEAEEHNVPGEVHEASALGVTVTLWVNVSAHGEVPTV